MDIRTLENKITSIQDQSSNQQILREMSNKFNQKMDIIMDEVKQTAMKSELEDFKVEIERKIK